MQTDVHPHNAEPALCCAAAPHGRRHPGCRSRADHEVSSVLAKRGPDERPASSSSYSRSTSASSTRSLCQPPLGAVTDPPVQHEQAHHEKRPKSHWHTSRLPAMLAPALPACSGHAVMPPPRCRCVAAAMSASDPAYPLSRAKLPVAPLLLHACPFLTYMPLR